MTAITALLPKRSQPAGEDDNDHLGSLGYEQELNRSVGAFASFASGFSFVSILTTVFQLFAFGFGLGGPAFFWTWPIVFIVQFAVALTFAELAAQLPICGCIYQWTRRISNEAVGWFAGWFMIIGYVVSVAAIAIALQAVLPPIWSGFQLAGGDSSLTSTSGATNAIILGTAAIAVCTMISSVGVRLMTVITRIGVTCELVGVVALIALLFAHTHRGIGVVNHTNGVQGHGSYAWPFLASMLMASYVMYGFDSAAELSEETHAPRRTAPRAIVRAMVVSGIGGGLLIIATLLAAPSVTSSDLSTQGISYVIDHDLPGWLGKLVLADVAISIFSALLAIQASAARVLFSMARDGKLPFAGQLSRVSPRSRTAIWPGVAVSVLAVAVLLVNLGQAELFTAVTSVSVVVVYLAYLMVTVPLLYRKLRGQSSADRLNPSGAGSSVTPHFSLGRWSVPINIIAVVGGFLLFLDVGWPRTAVYDPAGTHWYLRYFAPLFLAAALLLGVASYRRVRHRDAPRHRLSAPS